MEATTTKTPRAKPRYGVISNVGWMLRYARRTRTVLPFAAARIVLLITLNLAELLAAPVVLRLIEEGAPLGTLLAAIGLFTGGLLVCDTLSMWEGDNQIYGRIMVRMSIVRDTVWKMTTTSYPHLLTPAFMRGAQGAANITSSNERAAEAIWATLIDLTVSLVCFGVWLTLLTAADPVLLAVVVICALVSYFAASPLRSWSYHHREESQAAWQKTEYYAGRLQDRTFGKDVRIFGLRGWLEDLYAAARRLVVDFEKKLHARVLVIDLLEVLLTLVRNGVAYWYLLRQALGGGLSAAGFLLYFSAVSGLAAHVGGILTHTGELGRQSRELSALREWLDTPEPFTFEGGEDIPTPADGRYTLQLKDVSYRYPGAERDTLSHIDLTLAAGERLAVVGLNGAGKTTLIKLLCGYLDPTEGAVLLNGIDIRRFDRRQYYRLFSCVFQQHSILPGTIAENVAQCVLPAGDRARQASGPVLYAAQAPYDEARMQRSLAMAGLNKKVESLPNGVDTLLCRDVFNEAEQLSGGETQRLLLARALYRETPVLILDEPTAALDPLAESDLYQRYADMTAGRSAVYISHRLASTRFCDRILFLQDGRIAECGTHKALLAAGGGYARLFEVQRRYYAESKEEEGETI